MKKVKIIIIWYDLALVFTNFIILGTVLFLRPFGKFKFVIKAERFPE